jgi:hypothetical protein
MADPIIVLAWLVLAHLAADFVFQTEWIATEKFRDTPQARVALAAHVAVVGLCLVPFVAVFGVPGAALLGVVTLGHYLIDRSKIRLTRRVEARALAAAGVPERLPDDPLSPAEIDRAWTPIPAALFVADQLAHLALIGLAWWLLLSTAAVSGAWLDLMAAPPVGDQGAFHHATLAIVVILALLIVNTKAGSLFVVTLVKPRSSVSGVPPGAPPSGPPPERIGQAIGILERLLVVAFVLLRAEAAIGLVLAAKTIARFKQLDDREFAEYYLMGTLASLSVAIFSGLLAAAALG